MKLKPLESLMHIASSDESFTNAEQACKKLKKIYGIDPLITLNYLCPVFELINPKGKTILDLGCGSVGSPDSFFCSTSSNPIIARAYEPWLLRALYEYGANCIGVDLGNLTKEKFKGYSVDLASLDSLSMLPDKSVDLACAFRLFDSPSNFDLSMFNPSYSENTKKNLSLFQILLPQLKRIVKPESYFLFDTSCVNPEEYKSFE